MSSEWVDCTLGDFVRLQRGHDLTATEQEPGDFPVMGSAGPNGTHNKAIAQGPGVVIGRSGASIGRVHFCQTDYWPHNTCLYVTDFMGNNPRFAYYLLQTLNLGSYNSGSAQPSLNRNLIYTVPIKVPRGLEQEEIAGFLATLDDRVTLLRETNKTLEAIAQAIFKSWFVDFDPVRAKMEGRQPEGMDEETAALFPDSFEESASIPKGWKVSTVGESFILTMGQSPPGDTYNTSGDGLPFYQGRTDFGFRFPSKRVYCIQPSRFAETGDTLVSVRAPVGDVNMAIERCCIGRGVSAVRHPLNYHGFTFYTMKELGSQFQTYDTEGTVFGSINKRAFEGLSVVIPEEKILRIFDEYTAPIDNRITKNEQTIQTLTALRDTLLPRLISGQLRLPEAEALVEEIDP